MAAGDVGDYGSDKKQDSEVKLFYPNDYEGDDDCAGGGGERAICLVQL